MGNLFSLPCPQTLLAFMFLSTTGLFECFGFSTVSDKARAKANVQLVGHHFCHKVKITIYPCFIHFETYEPFSWSAVLYYHMFQNNVHTGPYIGTYGSAVSSTESG